MLEMAHMDDVYKDRFIFRGNLTHQDNVCIRHDLPLTHLQPEKAPGHLDSGETWIRQSCSVTHETTALRGGQDMVQ